MNQELVNELFSYMDGALYWKKDKGRIKAGTRAGTPRTKGHIQVQVNQKLYREHQLVWLMFTGNYPTKIIDHINGIPDDNRIENLRLATNSENLANRGKPKNNTSGYKGVYLHNQTKKWVASIMHQGKKHSLGCYNTPQEAHLAYSKACITLNKEFAKL
jgi:hypothetical protein